jgi:L-aminopeptidase/D-esterase-like protein
MDSKNIKYKLKYKKLKKKILGGSSESLSQSISLNDYKLLSYEFRNPKYLHLKPKLSGFSDVIFNIENSSVELDLSCFNIKIIQCEYRYIPNKTDPLYSDFNSKLFNEFGTGAGLTYIQFDTGATVYMHIAGGDPGLVKMIANNSLSTLDGICLSGGSLLGLAAATGINNASLTNKIPVGLQLCSSILFSHNLDKFERMYDKENNKYYIDEINSWNNSLHPDDALGKFAYEKLDDVDITKQKLYNGQYGAGLCCNYGQGWAYQQFKIQEIEGSSEKILNVLVLVVNNALGDIWLDERSTNKSITSVMKGKGSWDNYSHIEKMPVVTATTQIIVIIDIALDYLHLKQLTIQLNANIGRFIVPFNTFADGDVLYVCTTKKSEDEKLKPYYKSEYTYELTMLFHNIALVVEKAIKNSLNQYHNRTQF